MDPAWYNNEYKHAAYVAETGMHSITDPKGLRTIIREDELQDLGNMYSESFAENHPEFVHHFVEFNPRRVPRMLSRASHISNMKDPSLEAISEATQVGAGEYYHLKIES